MKIKINGREYSFFDDISISYKLDSVASAFSFKARFNPDNEFHKAIFKPLSYHKVEIFDNNNNLQLTGVSLITSLGSDSSRELQVISGYSKAGVLEDCSIPASSYPLEKLDVSLSDVVERLLSDFDLKFSVDSTATNDMNLIYKKTVASPSESVKSFISKLAAQRNIIISHDEKGDLVFFKPNFSAKPKLFLNQENTVKMSLAANGQSMHSELSVIRQPDKNNTSVSTVDTINNPMVGTKRTIVKVLSSGEATATKNAAENLLAAELKGITIKTVLRRLEDVKIGDIVEVQNKEIFLYNRARLVISEVNIKETSNTEEMSLSLVIPESFTGQSPKNIFE